MGESSVHQLTEKTKFDIEISQLLENRGLQIGNICVPPRKDPGTFGQACRLDTNIFNVNTRDIEIYRYEIQMFGHSRPTHNMPQGKRCELDRRGKDSLVIADRLATCKAAFRAFLQQNMEFFGENPYTLYYNLQSCLFSLKPLAVPPGRVCEFQLISSEDAPLPANLYSINMNISNVNEGAQRLRLSDLSALINAETLSRDRSILNFIELAVNQLPLHDGSRFLTLNGPICYFLDGNAVGIPYKRLDRIETAYLASGVSKSCFVMDALKIGLMLEAKYSPFYSTLSLFEFIRRNEATSALYHGFIRGQLEIEDIKYLNRKMRGIQLICRYPNGSTRKVGNWEFDIITPIERMIQNLNMSVSQYFEENYQKLQYPQSHLIHVRQKDTYFPAEVLEIADNQEIVYEKLDAVSKNNLAETCSLRPDHMKEANRKAAIGIEIHNSPYITNAEIEISPAPMKVNARVLVSPKIQYGQNQVLAINPSEAVWEIKQFLRPVNCKKFAIYWIHDQRRPRPIMHECDVYHFVAHIRQVGHNLGMQFGECTDYGSISNAEVEERIRLCLQNQVELCLFISPDNAIQFHENIKLYERYYGVATQDLKPKTVNNVLGWDFNTLRNYLAKANMKLGGLNYSVRLDNLDLMNEFEHTLFIAIATNQPGPKSIVDRVRGVNQYHMPGVLGYSYNQRHDEFIGDFHFVDAYRPEFYDTLSEIFHNCTDGYIKSRGRAPQKIVLFYNGLTEGQLVRTYKFAIPLIKEGIRRGCGTEIHLTVIGVQKKNGVRLFPEEFPLEGENHAFNVPHGTLVDTAIVSPVLSEFYLMAHSTPTGTAKIPRYTIVYDDNNYTMDLLEGVTHSLCYEHQIDGLATSLPTPIFVAAEYASRGRDIFSAAFREHEIRNNLPLDNNRYLDFDELTKRLNYSNSAFSDRRITA